jgi:serine phosphatase RsbU (regulator of sigma subunit)
VVARGRDLLDAPGGYIFLLDSQTQELELYTLQGIDTQYIGRRLRLGEGLSGRVAQFRKTMAIDNYHEWRERASPFGEVPLGPIVAAPLQWQDRLLGTLGFHRYAQDRRVFSPDDLHLIEQLAAQTAIAIQNARWFAESQHHARELDRRIQELALVNEISNRVNRLDLTEVQESALEQMMARFSAVYAALGIYAPASDTVTVTAVRPVGDPLLGTVFTVGNQPELAQAIHERRTILWRDDPDHVSHHPTRLYFRSRGTQQLLLAPLLVKEQVVGFIGIDPGLREVSEDEINLMQTVANQIATAMENARLYRVAVDKARIESELQLARSVQSRFLPQTAPLLPGWELIARWQPAREVSGDFYDFILLPEEQLGLVIGDATGKGMPAALVMAMTRAVIRAAAQGSVAPGLVLRRVNDLLCPDMPPRMFVTCFYGILDPHSGTFRYANAGQNLPFKRGRDGITKLSAAGLPLGLMPDVEYEPAETFLDNGESLLFYSDGLVEARNSSREMFGSARLARALNDEAQGEQLIERLLAQVALFAGPEWELEDDITLMTLHRHGT